MLNLTALVSHFAIWLYASALAAIPVPAAAAPGQRPAAACQPGETAIVIDTTAHRLHLCRDGAREQTFAVALGMGGVDKRRAGDNRTPLGNYPLGAPRASRWFHRFIPVAYPTPAQERAGFSGSAIGIHGPPRGLETAARLALLVTSDSASGAGGSPAGAPRGGVDWTAGCIAVATDAEIDQVAAWVDAHRVRAVRLRP